jgi:hypothetical protein
LDELWCAAAFHRGLDPYNPRPMASLKELQERADDLRRRFEQLKESL